jgi:hypothetical protein
MKITAGKEVKAQEKDKPAEDRATKNQEKIESTENEVGKPQEDKQSREKVIISPSDMNNCYGSSVFHSATFSNIAQMMFSEFNASRNLNFLDEIPIDPQFQNPYTTQQQDLSISENPLTPYQSIPQTVNQEASTSEMPQTQLPLIPTN